MGLRQIIQSLGISTFFSPLVNSTVVDDGYYNGFSFPHQLNDGKIITVYKKSGSHAAKGPMIFATSIDGGSSWQGQQISISGTPIECAAISLGVLSSGRILIAYQDDELYTSIKFAYSDDKGATWVASNTINFSVGYATSPSPVKMKVMPSGKIRCGYYSFGSGSDPAIVGFLNSTNNGVSWSIGETICSNTSDAPANFGDWKGHEFGFEITENTGNDSTCKMIALVRVNLGQEGGTYYMHYFSSNGGSTWSTDLVTSDAGSFVNDLGATVNGPFSRHLLYSFLPSNSPVDITLHNGTIYVLNGERNAADGFKLKYVTATPAGAYRNKWDDWARPVTVRDYTMLGGSIDCGYPIAFTDYQGKLWVHDYDVSTQTRNPLLTEDRCWIIQTKITD